MKLSKTAAHAALAVAFLARQPSDAPTQARTVSEYLGVPVDSALKVLQALARNGVIESRLGRAGGYCLTRAADEVTLLQIVEAMDGPLVARLPLAPREQRLGGELAALQAICEEAATATRDKLTRATVADLLAEASAEAA